jgi:hypothetical protein
LLAELANGLFSLPGQLFPVITALLNRSHLIAQLLAGALGLLAFRLPTIPASLEELHQLPQRSRERLGIHTCISMRALESFLFSAKNPLQWNKNGPR